ncbi:MAG: SusC/RagA family TonB-linked outer membrane protein [Bacteroidales bacterium]|jgi:TonB-linked SusC/RagA family outer membrane protein|nr:SusC/RagA family TonB-linked outer membrane protein [Bacteroidales bacterium]
MRKITFLLVFLLLAGVNFAFAQSRTITGKVTSAQDGMGIPGVTVFVKGTTVGTTTSIDGEYSLDVRPEHRTLIFRYVGMTTQEITIGDQNTLNVVLESDVMQMDEVVVTALGISREKKSLGYATQEISGGELSTIKRANVVSSLSGRAAGVQVRSTGNMGGSANVVIRGNSSLTQNNQALFVVDGVPISNANTNNSGQLSGRNGYDYGNAASDINPEDIESMNILKGAAATALYGSRAANGVVLITTKKGKKQIGGAKAFGVTINSNITTGFMDKSTFPKYQNQYGAGYGPFYGDPPYAGFELIYDVDGDGKLDYTVPTTEDASVGQKFDPNFSLYQYDSYDPASPNYLKKTPWTAGANGPETFFDTPISLTNSVDVSGGSETGTFRLSYTNMDEKGLMPNSSLKRNNFLFNGSYDVVDNLTVSASANYIVTDGKGRNSTGYSDNILSSFRQWYQTNVDMGMQETLYDKTGRNITWNPVSPTDLSPAYWDNPYWVRYENYETDRRERIIGYLQADWKIDDHFSLMGRASIDTYSELQEERKAVGSGSGEFGVGRPDVTSGYSRFDRSFMETNMDLMLRYYNQLTEDLNLNAIVGTNIRHSKTDQIFASTDGGLIVPGLFALANSVNPMRNPEERATEIGVNGIFASASLGFQNFLFLDATVRRDQSSTLPKNDNAYIYPSVSVSWLFHNNLNVSWLQLGKLRLNYAQVGNDAPWGSLKDTYAQNNTFGGTALFSLPSTKNNEQLRSENTSSIEAGLELITLNKRLGIDVAFYKNNTTDQIMPVAVSTATGYSSKYVNAGEIQNQGVELMVFGTPVVNKDFRWDVTLNWAKNVNEVVSLADGIDNLQIAALQGGVTINARKGEPYGTIQGTDYVYTNGQKTVKSNGYYMKTGTSDKVLGDINPDWNAGLNNRFTYKNWSGSFLIDWQQGGSIFSVDLWYGMATGLYEETVFTNDLGNPVRNSLDEGGGLILEGVTEDGSPNTKRVAGDNYAVWGYGQNPNAAFVYDATYIKLREVVISYSLPSKLMARYNWIQGVTFSVIGSNLWIISKDLPHADPEASQSSGNIQGWQSGVMPSVRNVGFSINLQF